MDFGRLYQKAINYYSKVSYTLFRDYSLPPIHTYISVTFKCNLNCQMCLTRNYGKGKYGINVRKDLSLEEMKNLVKQIPIYSLITFTGGEPFIRRDMLDILNFSCNHNKCTLISNGTMINDNIAKKIVNLGCKNFLSKGLIEVGFSVLGDKKMHDEIVRVKGAHKKIINAIKMVNKYKKMMGKKYPMISLRLVIQRNNVSYSSELIKLAERLNVDYCIFAVEDRTTAFVYITDENPSMINVPLEPVDVIDYEVLKRELKKLNQTVKKSKVEYRLIPASITNREIIKHYQNKIDLSEYECLYPWSKVTIYSDGGVHVCLKHRVGNIRKQSLKEIWNNKETRQFRRLLRKHKTFPSCIGCCGLEYKKNNFLLLRNLPNNFFFAFIFYCFVFNGVI